MNIGFYESFLCVCHFCYTINLVALSQCCVHVTNVSDTNIAQTCFFLLFFFYGCLFFHIVMVSNVGSEPLTVCPEMSCGEVTKIWLWCVDSVTAALEWCESPASAFMLDTKIFYTERLIKNQS